MVQANRSIVFTPAIPPMTIDTKVMTEPIASV
jgi:hypothetical protein